MKHFTKLTALLIMAVLPFTIAAQNPTVVLEYMKVTQESEGTYLQVEQAWKKIHQKRIEEGLSAGWQLWRKVHAGYNDPYQYITVNWYENYAQSFKPAPEGFFEAFMNGEDSEILNQTSASRVLAHVEVSHQIAQAENSGNPNLIVVNRMQVKPNNGSDYVKMELEVFKKLHEEGIRRGLRSHWGIWSNWPYDKDQAAYVTVDGYTDAAQLTAENQDYAAEVLPGMNMDELSEKILKLRKMESAEIWELVDAVFPE